MIFLHRIHFMFYFQSNRSGFHSTHAWKLWIYSRWLDYKPIGEPIKGTRFIAFKVPLSKIINEKVDDDNTRLDISQLLEKIPNLGLVIDLTFTTRYYDPKQFKNEGVQYVKLMIPGKGMIPQKHHISLFNKHVQDFVDNDSNTGKLIGVHCTHGVNRTGFLICQNMITHLKVEPEDALKDFEAARGHRIERDKYRDTLTRLLKIDLDDKQDKYEANDRSWRSDRTASISYDNRGYGAHPSKRGRYDSLSSETSRSQRSPDNNNRHPDRSSEWRNYKNIRHSSGVRIISSRRPDRQISRSDTKHSRDNNLNPDRHNQWRNYDNIREHMRNDPLPSNDPWLASDPRSSFSVMDQLYNNNEYSSSRFRWQRPSETTNKKK